MDNDLDFSIYKSRRTTVLLAKNKIYTTVNFAMVEAYWNIGKQIVLAQEKRSTYGTHLLKYLSEQLTSAFGTGFDVRNLQNM